MCDAKQMPCVSSFSKLISSTSCTKQKMDAERQLIESALSTREARSYFDMKKGRLAKSKEFSKIQREEAEMYWKILKHNAKNHAFMLNALSLAISMAPLESAELAMAFHRRAIYFEHMSKYDEALNDIERAIAITGSISVKVGLLCFQVQCYINLDRPEQKAVFEKVKFMFNKISDREPAKKVLKSKIDELEKIVGSGSPECTKNTEKQGIDVEEILSRKEVKDPFESFSIRYNEKDGRHLVAARDIKAGEIISVSKPYAINSNTELQPYLFCCHCMKLRWDSIPCNSCGWCFFCSDKCREEAWQQYHDIECAVIPMIRHTADHQHLRQLAVRTLILAVREAGGIAELQKSLEEADKCSDERSKGFSQDGKFQNDKFISIYSLMSRRSPNLAKSHVNDAVKILITFAKSTTLFGTMDKFKTFSKLSANQDAIFIGTLLLKLFGIFSVNYQEVWEHNSICKDKHNKKICFTKRCCYRTSMISPLFSLINHSCNPNAAVLYTDAIKLMLVALKPIKKDDQIYHTYSGCGLYSEEKKVDRQWMCKTAYNFTCKCKACLNNWPIMLKKVDLTKEKRLPDIEKSVELVGEKLKRMQDLLTSIEEKKIQYDESTLNELANAIEIAVQNYAEPSLTIATLVNALSKGYRSLYLKKLRFPSHCQLH